MTNSINMDANASHEEDLDIDALNDSQLYDKLRENNIVAGPIVDSTRDIYKKKLKKVLYGDEEETNQSFVGGDDGESELVSDRSRSWSEIVDEEEKEEEIVTDGDLTGPVVENEGGEEVVDGANGGQCETNSETEDDQPSGVSRPVDTSAGLRKRGNDGETKKENGINVVDPQPETKTSPLVLVLAFLLALVAAVVAITFVTNDVSDVDAMQEAILEAASKAVGGEGGEEAV